MNEAGHSSICRSHFQIPVPRRSDEWHLSGLCHRMGDGPHTLEEEVGRWAAGRVSGQSDGSGLEFPFQ